MQHNKEGASEDNIIAAAAAAGAMFGFLGLLAA
jgi:hypothetical protein